MIGAIGRDAARRRRRYIGYVKWPLDAAGAHEKGAAKHGRKQSSSHDVVGRKNGNANRRNGDGRVGVQ